MAPPHTADPQVPFLDPRSRIPDPRSPIPRPRISDPRMLIPRSQDPYFGQPGQPGWLAKPCRLAKPGCLGGVTGPWGQRVSPFPIRRPGEARGGQARKIECGPLSPSDSPSMKLRFNKQR